MHVVKTTHEFQGVFYTHGDTRYTLTYEQAKQIREAIISLGVEHVKRDILELEFKYIAIWKRIKRAQLDHIPLLTNSFFAYGIKHGGEGLLSKYEAALNQIDALYLSDQPTIQFIKEHRPTWPTKVRHVVPISATHSCLKMLQKRYIRPAL